MTLRAIIIDDEPLSRQRIRDLLAEEDVEIIGECEDGLQAIELVRERGPDLLFLDIQMPGLDGFEVLAQLDEPRPMIIFTTAYDSYAVRAFDAHALDYLLKPIDEARFRESLQRARQTTSRDEWSERVGSLLARLERQPQQLKRIVVKTPGKVFFVETREVDWFESAGNYVRLHTATGDAHLVRMTMQALEGRLDPRAFARIHRGTIVNVGRVAALHAKFRGEYDVVLRSGTRLPMQRAYQDRLRAAIGDF